MLIHSNILLKSWMQQNKIIKLLKENLFEKHVEIKNKKCLVFLKCWKKNLNYLKIII